MCELRKQAADDPEEENTNLEASVIFCDFVSKVDFFSLC